mgnify:CR=1 FL=1
MQMFPRRYLVNLKMTIIRSRPQRSANIPIGSEQRAKAVKPDTSYGRSSEKVIPQPALNASAATVAKVNVK